MRPLCYKEKTMDGKRYFLYKESDKDMALAYHNMIQNTENMFFNISFSPYHGTVYKDGKYVWLIIG